MALPSTEAIPSIEGKIRPGLDEVAEHNAGVPGIVGDQRQRIQRAIVGVAIVDDFDRRRHRIDRGGDMHERRHAALRRKIALEPHGDFELKPDSAVGGRAQARAGSMDAVGQNHAGDRAVDPAHGLHALWW